MSPEIRPSDIIAPPENSGESVRSRLARWIIKTPSTGYAGVLVALLTIVFAVLMLWARQEPLVAVGRIMDQARTVRAPFSIEDKARTERDRESAYRRSPRVYTLDLEALAGLRAELESLAPTDSTAPSFRAGVAKLIDLLRTRPLVAPSDYQADRAAPSEAIELAGTNPIVLSKSDLLSVADPQRTRIFRMLAITAGFEGDQLALVETRLAALGPFARFDESLTQERARAARAGVAPAMTDFTPGMVIADRREPLTSAQYELLRAEAEADRKDLGFWQSLLADTSVLTIALLAALGVAAFTAAYAPRAARSPKQLAAICALLAGGLLLSCVIGASEPKVIVAAAVVPAVLVACVLAIAFDRRTALALGSLLGLVCALALNQPMVVYGLCVLGVGTMVWQLRDVRHRQSLIRAGFTCGLCVFVGAIVLLGVQRPMVPGILREIAFDATTAAIGSVLVGFIVLGLLPGVEKLFAVTTGMTLVELRDPQRPLLRELQRRAPGTYNHSLNVASMAEAAAIAIGADGLLAYVGSLYHDVGKMSKPEYFVENQQGGPNKHEKLPPAMSLLVIVAHVKDGIELANQFQLPGILHHFIEAHHGTTLVEYFFHRAKRQAEQSGSSAPVQELEYRYPGPRPRTKEVAILMICDAAESATRTLPDPTPARIDSLVRAIAHKRLMDGQFDECDLTLRELSSIIDAVTRTLAAIHHARIAYPEAAKPQTFAAPVKAAAPAAPGPVGARA
jgi:putative nucleotidyltransferase with HDIG domain